MTTRQQKVSSLIQREVSEYFNVHRPEGLSGLLTITKVDASPDLKHAKVFFSVVGQDEKKVVGILKKNLYDLQGVINRKLKMKMIPRIHFVADITGEYAEYISRLIKQTKQDG